MLSSLSIEPTAGLGANANAQQVALPGISLRNNFTFRRGQQEFLLKLADALAQGQENSLGVFVPGYGKTITALASFVVAHALKRAARLVVFVPRGNLRDQYADPKELGRIFYNLGAPSFSFCIADSERVFLKNLSTPIIITTYQYASGRNGHAALLKYCSAAPCMFVFDEVHHLSDDGLWARKLSEFPFACSVALSGTPMRSDNRTLFGVPFEVRSDGEQYYVSLHEVTMRDAHAEGKILKRVNAHVVDYRLKMLRADTGEVVEISLSQMAEMAGSKSDVDAFLARRKLRFHEVYLETLLTPAFECFREKREGLRAEIESGKFADKGRNHQMLVIAMSNRHAAAILEFVQRRFPEYRSARIGQDVAAAERGKHLEDYRQGRLDVMVQVDMIGEGTDIKPISIIVKADLVRAYSKTLQQVFRGMRYYDGFSDRANVCDIYAANDSLLIHTLEWITSEEQIGIKLRQEREEREAALRGAPIESVWELTAVEGRDMKTHTLELFPEFSRPIITGKRSGDGNNPEVYAFNVSEQENALRNECANLAARLSQILRGRGHTIDISAIHADAKRRFSKAQEELSLAELTRKRDWLIRCLDARKML